MKGNNSFYSGNWKHLPGVLLIALFLLSSASLGYEINITRIFSVTQFYHFAFLIVSIALLGFGASGAFLASFPDTGKKNIINSLLLISLLAAISFISAYLITNHLPFDSFSITLGWKYVGVLVLHMVVLASPFFFSGLAVITLINSYPHQVNLIYAVNLTGSAVGCLLAMVIPNFIGAVGLVIVCTFLGLLATIFLGIFEAIRHGFLKTLRVVAVLSAVVLAFCILDVSYRITQGESLEFMKLNISPYKGISYILQYPDAETIFQKWNAYSRVDLIKSGSIRSLPGYSYLSPELPPEQLGLFIDGGDLSPVIQPELTETITGYLPSSVAYDLRPNAKTLILEPHGGLEILIAKSRGISSIYSSEPNSLVIEASEFIYSIGDLTNHRESGRSYLIRSQDMYDVIVISLNSSFHPVRSGSYGLGEDYRYTVESFRDALTRLNAGGLLVLTRWLQTPPSEFLRAFAIGIEAVEGESGNPGDQIAAFRSYNTGTMLIKNGSLTIDEINLVKKFAANLAYDVVYFPGIKDEDVNKYNILPEPYYYQSFTSLLKSENRDEWYTNYPYHVEPTTDDRPFFNQYFKWSQLPQIIAEFGKVWQPFGGAGFIILLIILILTILLSLSFILIPTMISLQTRLFSFRDLGVLLFFAAIGLAFLFVEIPLIQQFILFLENPPYSLTTVLFAILFFSGLGSRLSNYFTLNTTFIGLILSLLISFELLRFITNIGLGLPLFLRITLTVFLLAPLGFFMGIPFPKAVSILQDSRNQLIPWAWSINGSFSVVASVAAALFALSFGFRYVYILGSLIYFIAWLLIRVQDTQNQPHHQ